MPEKLLSVQQAKLEITQFKTERIQTRGVGQGWFRSAEDCSKENPLCGSRSGQGEVTLDLDHLGSVALLPGSSRKAFLR